MFSWISLPAVWIFRIMSHAGSNDGTAAAREEDASCDRERKRNREEGTFEYALEVEVDEVEVKEELERTRTSVCGSVQNLICAITQGKHMHGCAGGGIVISKRHDTNGERLSTGYLFTTHTIVFCVLVLPSAFSLRKITWPYNCLIFCLLPNA
mmetsp:Transcript_20656/g.42130  ORF Transcript_20656/g.42130 Transcript_20656/m.42130 type:complete len:153 (-) Transcript_20656:1461-1919(-)